MQDWFQTWVGWLFVHIAWVDTLTVWHSLWLLAMTIKLQPKCQLEFSADGFFSILAYFTLQARLPTTLYTNFTYLLLCCDLLFLLLFAQAECVTLLAGDASHKTTLPTFWIRKHVSDIRSSPVWETLGIHNSALSCTINLAHPWGVFYT